MGDKERVLVGREVADGLSVCFEQADSDNRIVQLRQGRSKHLEICVFFVPQLRESLNSKLK